MADIVFNHYMDILNFAFTDKEVMYNGKSKI